MPLVKTAGFRPKDLKISRAAKALAHPARVAILRELARRNACVCGEFVELLPLAQATVSQHLKELRRAGLVQGEVEGPRACYCLAPKAVEETAAIFEDLLAELKASRLRAQC
jgi:DNA-binding transcriptional ArsR family regulator